MTRFRRQTGAWIAILVLAVTAAAQDIDLSGRVLDDSGRGLAGATVELLAQHLETQTDSSGSWQITQMGVRSAVTERGAVPRVSVRNGRLLVDVTGGTRAVRVDVFDAAGRRCATPVRAALGQGMHALALPTGSAADAVNIIRVRVGETVSLVRCVSPAQAGAGVVQTERAPMRSAAVEQRAGPVDTLRVSLDGYVPRQVLLSSYLQTLVVHLSPEGELVFRINDGDRYTVVDTCRLRVVDRTAQVVGVRFTDSLSNGTPVFGVSTARNVDSVCSVADSAAQRAWVLCPGAERKTVWAECTRTDSTTDTLSDDIDVAPYSVSITFRSDTVGGLPSLRQTDSGYSVLQQRWLASYVTWRPWFDFSVAVDGDPSFSRHFEYCVAFPAADQPILSGFPVLRSAWKRDSLTAEGPLHDTTHTYRIRFSPDSAGAVFDSLYRDYGFEEVSWLYSADGALAHMKVLKEMSSRNTYDNGRKELALVLRLTGRYFGESRVVIMSGRMRHDVGFMSYVDFYPPMVWRDSWEYEFPFDGDTIEGPFTVNLNTAADPCPVPFEATRGHVCDRGGADVVAIDLYLAEMTDSMAAAWVPDTSCYQVTMDQLLALPHRSFPARPFAPSERVCPVSWPEIDPTDWYDGFYLVAIVTSDCYGNHGIAPYFDLYAVTNRQENTNPQHWRIVTNNHAYE